MDNQKNLRILTYNFFMRPPGIHDNGSDYKGERLKSFLNNELNNWDIICFQEMFGSYSKRKNTLLNKAKKCGFKYHIEGPIPNVLSRHIVDGGLMILSRFQIVAKESIIYSKGTSSDALASKGVLYAKIKLPNGMYFHVFTTHLQASYYDRSVKRLKEFESIRLNQMKELRDFMHIITKDDTLPIFLMGDMNVPAIENNDESDEYHQMMNFLNTPYFKATDILKSILGYHPPTIGRLIEMKENSASNEVGSRLDYIFFMTRRNSTVVDLNFLQHRLRKESFEELFKKDPLPEGLITVEKIKNDEISVVDDLESTEAQLNTSIGKFRIEVKESQVEQFIIKGKDYSQLSDHYGVSCIVIICDNTTTIL